MPSHLYSFSFAPNPNWSSTFSPQPEILDYLRDCSKRYGLLPHVRFHTELVGAEWDDDEQLCRIETSQGEMTAEVLIAGPGPLSEPLIPSLPGLGRFEGTRFHSAAWDREHVLDGRALPPADATVRRGRLRAADGRSSAHSRGGVRAGAPHRR